MTSLLLPGPPGAAGDDGGPAATRAQTSQRDAGVFAIGGSSVAGCFGE